MEKHKAIIEAILPENPNYCFLTKGGHPDYPLWTHWWPLTKEKWEEIIQNPMIERLSIRWDGNHILLNNGQVSEYKPHLPNPPSLE